MTGQDSVRARSFGKCATRDRAAGLRPGALLARNLQSRCSIKLVLTDEAFGLSQAGATRHAPLLWCAHGTIAVRSLAGT